MPENLRRQQVFSFRFPHKTVRQGETNFKLGHGHVPRIQGVWNYHSVARYENPVNANRTSAMREPMPLNAAPNHPDYNMTTPSSTIVQRVWNYCNVLRDDGGSGRLK